MLLRMLIIMKDNIMFRERSSSDKFYYLSLTFLFIISLHNASPEEDIPGLYQPSDPIVELTNDTIMVQLKGNNKIWLIEFYSSWCGHCQAFAPKWVKLAVQLQNWNYYVNVGAVNCANGRNRDTCNTFSIGTYPTIKYFNAHWQNITEKIDEDGYSEMGFTFKGSRGLTNLRHKLIDIIENQTHPKYDRSKIPFKPMGLDQITSFIKEKKGEGFKYFGLVFDDDEDEYIGKTIMMDTSKSKHLLTRRADKKDSALLQKYKVTEFPSLVMVQLGNGEYEHLSLNNRTYLGFVYSLQKILNSVSKVPKETPKKVEEIKVVEKPKLKKDFVPPEIQEIHMSDLTSAVSFALRHEIPKKPVIKGDALVALNGWVEVLLQCFPAEKNMLSFLRNLDMWIQNNNGRGKITSADYIKFVEHNKMSIAYLPQQIQWRSCKGSEPKFRGFPCSLWTLFHTMTVDCSSKYSKTTLSGLDVLKRIRGFIDHFFGCQHCRDHFMEMAKNLEKEVTTHNSAIMWLWERHNRVNARLREHISADPQFPKVQFPMKEMCEECRNTEKEEYTMLIDPGHGVSPVKWNKMATLGFLKEHYGPDNIRIDGVEKENSPHKKVSYKFYPRSGPPATLSFIGLTRIDMSLCLMMYVVMIGTLIALYLYFIKRGKKKQWKSIV